MNNISIIANEAIASGFFEEEEISSFIENGIEIPFHTFSKWKSLGYIPKNGQHGWECFLWKKKRVNKNKSEESSEDIEIKKNEFYLAKSYLFHSSQVKTLEEDICL